MTGIVPTLITGDNIRLLRQVIGNFTFSFVAPLTSYYYNSCHFKSHLTVEFLNN